jgi:hypothetical protein
MRMKQIVVIGAFVAILVVGGGVAIADGGVAGDQDAFLNDVAKRLNVTPAALKAALKGASDDRIDAAVAAGKITKAQGDAMKARSAQGGVPFFGGPHGDGRPGFGHRGPGSLDAAAKYLGLTVTELHTQLESGKTLAQIAKDKGKTVDGLKAAITADTKAKLDAAVKAGNLTQAQADDILKRMTDRLDDLINGTGGGPGIGPDGDGDGFGHHGFGGMQPGGMQPGGTMPQGSGNFTPVPA